MPSSWKLPKRRGSVGLGKKRRYIEELSFLNPGIRKYIK